MPQSLQKQKKNKKNKKNSKKGWGDILEILLEFNENLIVGEH